MKAADHTGSDGGGGGGRGDSTPAGVPHSHLGLCRALYTFQGERDGDLSFQAGEVLRVIQKNPRWWAGIAADGRTGVFPSNYVDLVPDEELASFHYIDIPTTGPVPTRTRGGSNCGGGSSSASPHSSGGSSSTSGSMADQRPSSTASPTATTSSTTTAGGDSPASPMLNSERQSSAVDEDDIEARLNRLKFSGSGKDKFNEQARKSYRVSQLLAWEEVTGDATIEKVTQREQTIVPPTTPKPKAKKYFEEVAKLQETRGNYINHVKPLLETKAKEFDLIAEDYFRKLRIAAQQSGVTPDIVQKLIDAEQDRVKLVSWSLFHPEALDMHPLESNIAERSHVLETEQSIISVQSYVRRWLVQKRYGAELKVRRQRRLCALEIVKTERSYVSSLESIVEQFMKPLEQSGIISNDDKLKLFSNVTLILGVNQTMLKQLEERTGSWTFNTCLGDIFLALSPYLRMYTTYINNYSQSVETYQRLIQQPNFVQTIEKCREQSSVSKLAFQDLQIMPVQRVPRYVLLVTELLKYTPEGHPDYQELTKALTLLREVATKINENRRLTENMQKLVEIQRSITGFSEELVQPSRWLVHEGTVQRAIRGSQTSCSQCYLFLFNDILVITERRRYLFEDKHYYIFKEQIALYNMGSGNLEGSSLGFVLRTKYGVVESFIAENTQQRDVWVRHLESVIDDLRKNRATLKLDISPVGDSSLRLSTSSSTTIDTRRRSSYAVNEAENDAAGNGKDDQHALIAALSSLSVPTTAARPTTPPISPHSVVRSPSPQQPLTPPLATTSTLGEVVSLLNEALALEREIFQRPIEIQTIMPDYCRSIHPQHLQMMGDRLRLLHTKLNEIRILQQKVKTLLLKDEPIKGVQSLDSLIKDGRASIGELKNWVQQAFPAGSLVYSGAQPVGPRAMMAALLKWYLSLSDAWTALLAQPVP